MNEIKKLTRMLEKKRGEVIELEGKLYFARLKAYAAYCCTSVIEARQCDIPTYHKILKGGRYKTGRY